MVTRGRLGFGNIQQPTWQSADARHRRELVQQEVRRGEEEDRQVRAVSLKQQGQYMKWESARPRKISWNEMWRMDGQKISFLLRSVYDVLPTPTNLTTWKLNEDPSCKLCGNPANLEHVLSSCRTALKDGRFTWRHDQVLREIAAALDIQRRKKTTIEKGPKFINFIKGGRKTSRNANSKASGILATANDWEMQADVGGKTIYINNTPARHSTVVKNKQTGHSGRVDSTMGNKTGRSPREKAHQVPGLGNRHPGKELENLVFSSGSRL